MTDALTPASKLHALVVDDDESTREFVEMLLKKWGYQVTLAPDGMAALECCGTQVFDVVVCDIRMPKLSGVSFARNVRMRHPGSVRRLVFVSSLDDAKVRGEVADVGGVTLISKPIATDKLRQALGFV
jgi:two-component system, NtrC family, response regulator PilR